MIELRTNQARLQAALTVTSITRHAAQPIPFSAPPTSRRCATCGCHLSRYARWDETRCAPCQRKDTP